MGVLRLADADLAAARPQEGELAGHVVALDDERLAVAADAVTALDRRLPDRGVALDDDRAEGAPHLDTGGGPTRGRRGHRHGGAAGGEIVEERRAFLRGDLALRDAIENFLLGVFHIAY